MGATKQSLLVMGILAATACAARAQEVPPVPVPATPPVQSPVVAPTPQPPVATSAPAVPPAAETVATAPRLSDSELRERRNAIFLMEGVLAKAVRLAAGETAEQIQSVQPGISMFTSSPAKALGTYLEGYGVFFQVEIPSVMPSVVNLVESLRRDRATSPAQTAAMAARSPEAVVNPDAHYVDAVKRQLVEAMVFYSNSMSLRPDEWLTVAAREAQEAPGQVDQPSTLILRVKGSDLAEFLAGRISRDEIRRRVQARGF